MIGQTISHYKILEKLGEGGMGVVYKARDEKLHRDIALKFLPPYLTTDKVEQERFLHEAQAAATLNHPNITTVYEIDEHNEQLFLAMELVEGQTLRQLIGRQPLSIEKVVEIAIQLCEGLASAHEKGIVHRDIKPENIMVTTKAQTKIMDFGLAKIKGATKLTKTGSTLGTIGYMSPEQTRGEELDQRSDIFSVGTVLYEMLTGTRSFKGEHEAAISYSILNEDPLPILRFNNKASAELERIVFKALNKNRDERYQHADELLADLRHERKTREYERSGYVKATTGATVADAPQVSRKLPKYLIAVAGLVLLTLLFVIFNPLKLAGPVQSDGPSGNFLAVMYFENIPDPADRDHTGEMLTNLLITALFQSKGLEVVSRERLYDIQKELSGESKAITHDLAGKVAEKAGVSMMLLGSILQTEPTLTITFRIVEVRSGKILSTQRLIGRSGEKIFSFVDTLAFLVRSDLQIAPALDAATRPVAEVTTTSRKAYRSYLEGVDLIQKLSWKEAVAAFDRAIELDQNFAMAYLMLSRTKEFQADMIGARDDVQKAHRLSGRTAERERLLIGARFAGMVEGDRLREAELLEQFLDKYPHEQGAYLQLQFAYMRLNEPEKGIQATLRGLKYFPEDKVLWNVLAYDYADMNRKEEAHRAANRYLELAPGEFNPYDSKGEICQLFGDVDSALYWYEKAITFRPMYFTIEKKGYIALLRRDYAKAEIFFRQGSSSTDSFDRVLGQMDLSLINIHHGQLGEARSMLNNYLKSPQAPEVQSAVHNEYLLLALLAYEQGKYPEMVKYAQARSAKLKKDPTEEVFGRDLLVWALHKNGDLRGSQRVLDELKNSVTKRSPRAQVIYDHANALIAYEEGRYEASLELFRKVSDNLVLSRMPQYFYAVVLVKTGQTGEAMSEFDRMTRTSPISPPSVLRLDFLPTWLYWPFGAVKAHYWLGTLYEQQGKKDKALKEYETFLDIWKDADFKSEEIEDARARAARLRSGSPK